MYVAGPDMCSRVLCARNARAARAGAIVAGVGLLGLSALVTLLGVAARRVGPGVGTAREALPGLIAAVVPLPLSLLVQLGLLAALVSSADTCVVTAATVAELDLVGRLRRGGANTARTRALVVGVTAAALLVAWLNPRIIGNIMLAYAFYAGGILVPVLVMRCRGLALAVPRAWVWTAMGAGGLLPLYLLVSGVVSAPDFLLALATAGALGAAANLAVIACGTLASNWRRAKP